ncbi:MAG TPA: response regulator [Myxococcales bacterium]|nr:response regulator [Myxococcales bacterium]
MHVLSWLKERGVLTPAQYEGALHQAQRTGDRVEEAILDTGAMREAELLKLLASHYQTRFVSTERLSKANIERKTLERIPRKLAERLQVFPVVFDRRAQQLSIVVAAPGEDDLEKQVQVVSGVREVRSLVARPAAIAAAIEKFYAGHARAFEELFAREMPDYGELDAFETTRVGGPSAPSQGGQFGSVTASGSAQHGDADFADPFAFMGPAIDPPPADAPPTARVAPREPAPQVAPAPLPAPVPLEGTIPIDSPLSGTDETPRVSLDDYLETLNVFVSLLDRDRGELRGHSGQVARLCRLVAERVGLSGADRHALVVAAYIHDLGKTGGDLHLTALNVARHEGHRGRATKSRLSPVKLFASAQLPPDTKKILGHLYERFDGKGLPDRLAGKDIPYGARVLAIVETYSDLTTNSKNPYRRVLSIPQALSVLKELGGELFDPTLVDLLRHVVVGDDGAEQLGTRPRVLIVDPDPEETTVLEMRLIEHGFAVEVARELPAALALLAERPPEVIVTEVDLSAGGEGFTLMERVRELGEADRPAVLFLTGRADRESVTKGFELGATDYVVKPASPEVVATKAGQAVEGASRQEASGVSGSLEEMSLPDVVQILANGRRGGRLQIVAGAKRGEIHFCEGQIHDARFGERTGEEAFYALLKLDRGRFTLDPRFEPPARVIHASAEGLLLEGMRRLDEGLV